ncbi:AAA family ATPase [Nocardiopsis quinghaiensis]|uniref:AAA family ATPase n=1 Tax=Nocardiopsis quinghaiensis TaxID=464995 RepID=UPI00123C2329|nr:AAA family ATPase [Nocardiopsis quinghaiensis]
MESPLFDFRAALSGAEPEPLRTEEEPAPGEQDSPSTASRADAAPISVDLSTGLLLLRHGPASVEVDTATQDAVLDPAGTGVTADGDGVMLLAPRGDTDTASPHLLPGEEVTRTVSVAEPETGDVSGQEFRGAEARTASVPAEPGAARETAAPVEPAATSEPAFTGGTTALASEPLSTHDHAPKASREPLLEGTRTGSGEPVAEAVPISAGTEDPAHEESGAEDGDAGAPAVTLDPETGVTTVEAGDLKFVMDADTGTVSIEPGDRHVPLDPEAAPVTIETGTLLLTIDPETGTVGIDTVEPEEGEKALPTTIEIGDLRLALDPETGEVTLDPGDGDVEVDPDTGLITVSGKSDGDGAPDERDGPGSDGPGQDGAGRDSRTGESGRPDEESSGGDGADGGRTSGDVPRTPTQTAGSPDGTPTQTPGTPLSPLTPPLSSTPPEEQDTPGEASDGPVTPGGEYTPTTPIPGTADKPMEALVDHVPGDGDGDRGEDDWDQGREEANGDEDGDGGDGDGDEDGKEDGKDSEDDEESSGNEKGESGEATRIDLDQLKDFRKKFVIPLRERVSEEVTRFAPYQNAGGSGESAQHHILIGNAKFLESAGLLSSEIDTSLATLYSILTDLESELGLIEDRLHENMSAFVNLEDEQKLSAQDVVNLIGSPSAGTSSGYGYGNGYGNEEPAGETDDES